jgi:hypothetical protein
MSAYDDAKAAEGYLDQALSLRMNLSAYRLLRVECDHNRALMEVYDVNGIAVLWARFTGRAVEEGNPYHNPAADPGGHYVIFPADDPPPLGRITRQRWAAALPPPGVFDQATTYDVSTGAGCCVGTVPLPRLRHALDTRTRVMRVCDLESEV